MNLCVAILSIVFAMPVTALANVEQYPTEAMKRAIVGSGEVKAVLKVFESSRSILCTSIKVESLQAMTKDGASEYEAAVTCNDVKGGANLHKVSLKGFTYNSGHKIEALLTSVSIEAYE